MRLFGIPVSPFDRFMVTFSAVLVLAACTPVANFTAGTLNEGAGDEAILYLLPEGSAMPEACAPLISVEGVCFVPSYEAQDVRVRLRAEGLAIAPRPECSGDASALVCAFGAISDPVAVEVLSADRLAASATYRRAGSARVYQEIAIPYAVE